ncbi:unnamed protein product [Rotaria sordida]|uniref:Microbial-type PARG catalytic domain-containing protein n=1 Tax=Rotaria sordida TaxID=392033 RepID=A0A815IKU0_9BILA|nr:unnamed protein product [Rotaria sordida]CAF3978749.1 unnamed protein product [Rotaria sordida]
MSNTTTTNEQIDLEDASSLKTLSRSERAAIAEDTLNKLDAGWYCLDQGFRISLQEDVAFCMQNSVLYTEDDLQQTKKLTLVVDETDSRSFTTDTTAYTKIEVRHCTTLQAARFLVAQTGEDHVGVLNFASAKNPGGGFRTGACAQEESLARSSSLYPALTQPRCLTGYYDYNRHGERGIYSHRMIYSPRVTIFKDDNGELLSSPYHVSIVTVPAPNAGVMRDAEEIQDAMKERVKRLLYVFEANKHDTLVLGAFGCGVFKNNPLDVAIIFRKHLQSAKFKNSFKRIIFAVLNAKMCHVFKQVFAADDLNDIQQRIVAISLNHGNNKQHTRKNRNKQHKKVAKQRRKQNSAFE